MSHHAKGYILSLFLVVVDVIVLPESAVFSADSGVWEASIPIL